MSANIHTMATIIKMSTNIQSNILNSKSSGLEAFFPISSPHYREVDPKMHNPQNDYCQGFFYQTYDLMCKRNVSFLLRTQNKCCCVVIDSF